MMLRAFRVTALAGAAMLSASCESGPTFQYFKVESRFVASAQSQQAPEVIETPAYSRLAGTATTVAVRAPDQCSNNTTNQATGDAAAGGSILQTNCGVEMGEIERALTRAGFNVISWNIMARELERDESASAVAGRLGAQILFQINSLERSRKTLGQDARWERTYFTGGFGTAKWDPLPLSEENRLALSRMFLADIEAKANPRTNAVTLDAAAIWVPTGQSIWYYRWTRAADTEGVAAGYRVFLQCLYGAAFPGSCTQIANPNRTIEGPSTVLASGESVALSASERPEDAERAIYLGLVKDVVRDFVQSFARARRFAPSGAAASGSND